MDLILVVFIIFFFVFCCFTSPAKQFDDYLGVESTKGLRGVMAISIVFHHMSIVIESGRFFPLLVHIGYMIVAVFFFLSGYGLFVSFKKKGYNYLKGFWKSRILSLFIIYFICSVFYYVLNCFNGTVLSLIEVLKMFDNAKPIAAYSWYIIIQLVLYIIFWVSFKIKTKNVNINILFVFICEIVLMIVLILKGFGSTWYMSNFAFPLGMLWAEYKERIDDLLNKKYFLFIAVLLIIFISFSALPLIVEHFEIYFDYFSPICRIFSSSAFVAIVIAITRTIKPSKKFWVFFGEISLELYLVHGAVIWTLYKYISNDVVWTILTLAISIPLAYIFHLLNNKIFKLFRK